MENVNTIYEERDIHPIFRANPFLIEDGAKLLRGEKFLSNESLKHIDICLTDRHQIPLYVEIKWDSFDVKQPETYHNLLKTEHKGNRFRLMWLVPDDMDVPLPSYIELKKYSRVQFRRFVKIREEAKKALRQILKVLSTPTTPPSSLMYREQITFPSIISACYFEGEVKTERGFRKIGLRKQGVGRYLDIIRCLAQSQYAWSLPELTLVLIEELLIAPYYFERRGGRGIVDPYGFYHHIYEKRKNQIYTQIADIVISIRQITSEFLKKNYSTIKSFYRNDISKYDLLYRILLQTPLKVYEMGDLMGAKKLIEHLRNIFNLTPTQPFNKVKHTLTNQSIQNKVNISGYENDFAKRLMEIATLKRSLIPVSGVPMVRILVKRIIADKHTYIRAACQNFRLNKENKFVEELIEG